MASLDDILQATVSGMGYELVDIERSPRGRLIRVFIDARQKDGGINVEDCSLVSEQITRVFAVENIDYDRLEVSSPGLDRVVKTIADFIRFSGELATVKMRLPIDGRRNFQGTINGVRDDSLILLLHDAPNAAAKEVFLPLNQLDKVRLVPVFDDLKEQKK